MIIAVLKYVVRDVSISNLKTSQMGGVGGKETQQRLIKSHINTPMAQYAMQP